MTLHLPIGEAGGAPSMTSDMGEEEGALSL